MRKIISLFQRNYDTDRLVRDEVVPGAEWVIAGEGVATRKFDGTCCMVRDGRLWKRHEVKKSKAAPRNFEPAQEPEPITGNVVGWIPVGVGPEDKWFHEAILNNLGMPADGTYELCGPKVQGNPEGLDAHIFLRHGCVGLSGAPRVFDGIRDYLARRDVEGIVWHHPDGRMVKIKGKDFGIKRQPK